MKEILTDLARSDFLHVYFWLLCLLAVVVIGRIGWHVMSNADSIFSRRASRYERVQSFSQSIMKRPREIIITLSLFGLVWIMGIFLAILISLSKPLVGA